MLRLAAITSVLAVTILASRTIYDFDEQTQLWPKRELSLREICGGKVCVFVNVASEWGVTKVNYQQLNQLLRQYNDLIVIGQPCNQFGKQEPLSGKSLYQHILKKWTKQDRFYFLEKADVKGKQITPLYNFLANHKSTTSMFTPNRVLWNFEKFLVGRDGVPINRWRSNKNPSSMESEIRKALGFRN